MTEQERPALSGKTSASWKEKIETQLFKERDEDGKPTKCPKSEPKGRWDPHEEKIFPTPKHLAYFYSGHTYRKDCLRDREEAAKRAIREVLENHPEDDYITTGELMKHESITTQAGESESLDDMAKLIWADGQQDIDAEVPTNSITHSRKGDDNNGIYQTMTTAAQSVMDAGLNSLGPPLNPCVAYLRMKRCGVYGSTNMSVWKSPFLPNLDNKDGRRGLLDHQVTAIVWLLSRFFGDLPKLKNNFLWTAESVLDQNNRARLKGPKYFGAILADSMGLGKTLTTVALVELLIRQNLNAVRVDGDLKYRPILLLTPNATVANQWVEELSEVIDEHIICHIVTSGPGLEASTNQTRITHLGVEDFRSWPEEVNYMWDEDDPRASRVVIVMSIETWASRTCITCPDDGNWTSSFTDAGRKFSLVIVDEAYKVKNPKTKSWRSVYLLQRQFTLLITATPCLNTVTDLFGLVRLLWPVPELYLKQTKSKWTSIEQFQELKHLDRLDSFPSSDDIQLVAGRPGLLAKLLLKSWGARTIDIGKTRQYLRHFESLAMLRRSPSSHIYADWKREKSISLEGLFPKVENYTIDISAGDIHDREYQKVHIRHLIDYLSGLKAWKDHSLDKSRNGEEEAKVHIYTSHRLFQLAASSLDVYDLNQIITSHGYSTLSESIAEMREKGVNLLRLAQFLLLPHEEKPVTHAGCIKLAARNSPVLRYILHYIYENILVRKHNEPIKKLLIIEQNLMLAFYYELVLQFLGIECRCMHAQLSQDERQDLVDSFNSSDNGSCQILIQLYSVGFAGTNLHKRCSRVLVASQSYSLQVQWQTVHRVIRIGQRSDVVVHRIKLKNSYHTFQESRQIEKILPDLGTRAHGDTKSVLVRLLNLFQYEVREAWHSREGQKLLNERDLLDEETFEDCHEPHLKRIKLEDEMVPDITGISTKDSNNSDDKYNKINANKKYSRQFIKEESPTTLGYKTGTRAYSNKKVSKKILTRSGLPFKEVKSYHTPFDQKRIKIEGKGDVSENQLGAIVPSYPKTYITPALKTANTYSQKSYKRKLSEDAPKSGDGNSGWYDLSELLQDHRTFLSLQTRDKYYGEFISLPRHAKSCFSHDKNKLRRLLSYGCINGVFFERQWQESDLENPAVLERALELMLRVRLGANDIAMLPFPTIDLSGTPLAQRKVVHELLAELKTTDQELDQKSKKGKDRQETIRGVDLKKSVGEIEKALDAQDRLVKKAKATVTDHTGDIAKGSGVMSRVKKEIDPEEDDEEDDEENAEELYSGIQNEWW